MWGHCVLYGLHNKDAKSVRIDLVLYHSQTSLQMYRAFGEVVEPERYLRQKPAHLAALLPQQP